MSFFFSSRIPLFIYLWCLLTLFFFFLSKLWYFQRGFLFVCFCLFWSFVFSRATPVVHGGSQAGGSNQSCCRRPTPQPQQNASCQPSLGPAPQFRQCQILNLLSEVRDQTRNLKVPRFLVGFVSAVPRQEHRVLVSFFVECFSVWVYLIFSQHQCYIFLVAKPQMWCDLRDIWWRNVLLGVILTVVT